MEWSREREGGGGGGTGGEREREMYINSLVLTNVNEITFSMSS